MMIEIQKKNSQKNFKSWWACNSIASQLTSYDLFRIKSHVQHCKILNFTLWCYKIVSVSALSFALFSSVVCTFCGFMRPEEIEHFKGWEKRDCGFLFFNNQVLASLSSPAWRPWRRDVKPCNGRVWVLINLRKISSLFFSWNRNRNYMQFIRARIIWSILLIWFGR